MLPRLTTPTLNQTYTELPLNDSLSSVLNQTEPEPILTNPAHTNSLEQIAAQELPQGGAIDYDFELILTLPT